jgi:O-antigen ligase
LKGTSQPVGGFCVAIVAWQLRRQWISRRLGASSALRSQAHAWRPILRSSLLAAFLAILAACVIFTTSSKQNRSAFDGSGRFHTWALVMKPWWTGGGLRSHLVGQGTGSTRTLLEHFQTEELALKSGDTAMLWADLHNDYLQVLLENGFVGLALGLIFACFGLVFAFRKSEHLFSAFCTYLACSVFNPLAHWPIHAAAGVLIVAMVFEK